VPSLLATTRIVCVDLGSTIYPSKENGIATDAIRSVSDQFAELCQQGFKLLVFAAAGTLGKEYVEIARKYTRDGNALRSVRKTTSNPNALLLINRLQALSVRTRSKPFQSLAELEEISKQFQDWDVLVAEDLGADAIQGFAKKIGAKSLVRISEKDKAREKNGWLLVTSYPNILSIFRKSKH
jgi:uridylate kinase